MIRAGLVDQTDHAFCDVRVDLVDDLPGFAEELLRVVHESLRLSCSLIFSKVILDMNLWISSRPASEPISWNSGRLQRLQADLAGHVTGVFQGGHDHHAKSRDRFRPFPCDENLQWKIILLWLSVYHKASDQQKELLK